MIGAPIFFQDEPLLPGGRGKILNLTRAIFFKLWESLEKMENMLPRRLDVLILVSMPLSTQKEIRVLKTLPQILTLKVNRSLVSQHLAV